MLTAADKSEGQKRRAGLKSGVAWGCQTHSNERCVVRPRHGAASGGPSEAGTTPGISVWCCVGLGFAFAEGFNLRYSSGQKSEVGKEAAICKTSSSAVLFQQLDDNGVECIYSLTDKCHLLCLALVSKYRCSNTVVKIFIASVIIFRWLFWKYILFPPVLMVTQTAYLWFWEY